MFNSLFEPLVPVIDRLMISGTAAAFVLLPTYTVHRLCILGRIRMFPYLSWTVVPMEHKPYSMYGTFLAVTC